MLLNPIDQQGFQTTRQSIRAGLRIPSDVFNPKLFMTMTPYAFEFLILILLPARVRPSMQSYGLSMRTGQKRSRHAPQPALTLKLRIVIFLKLVLTFLV